jgi:hypothetical protein
MPHTAADLLLERLMEWGVDTVFGLPGDGINGVWESLRRHRDRIRYVHVRHEEVGAMAAVGYAKFTGRLGVRLSTSGPGAIHLANGLLDARLEQAPLLASTRMTYHDLAGTSYLQDFDTDYLFSNLALYTSASWARPTSTTWWTRRAERRWGSEGRATSPPDRLAGDRRRGGEALHAQRPRPLDRRPAAAPTAARAGRGRTRRRAAQRA